MRDMHCVGGIVSIKERSGLDWRGLDWQVFTGYFPLKSVFNSVS